MPYKTIIKIIFLYILMFMVLYWVQEHKSSKLNSNKHYPSLICSQFLHEWYFEMTIKEIRQIQSWGWNRWFIGLLS